MKYYPSTTPEARRAKRAANKDAVNARQRAWTARNPEKIRSYNLKQSFGLTVSEWDAMLKEQAGRCGSCGDPMTAPHTDHDHTDYLERDAARSK